MANGAFGQCGKCGESLTPRGGLPPRFCPRCGSRLQSVSGLPPGRVVAAPEGVCGVAVAALVVGIIGLVAPCIGGPLGLSAIFLGIYARMKIEESGGRLWGNGLAIAGIVLGVIAGGMWLAVCAHAL